MADLDALDGDPDFEPSLGSVAAERWANQQRWAKGARDDGEQEHDGREPDVDDEHTLGWSKGEGLNGRLGIARNDEEPSLGLPNTISQLRWGHADPYLTDRDEQCEGRGRPRRTEA